MTSPWLRPEEAMPLLYLKCRNHYNFMCRAGRVKARKVGRNWLTRIEWLDEMDESKRKR